MSDAVTVQQMKAMMAKLVQALAKSGELERNNFMLSLGKAAVTLCSERLDNIDGRFDAMGKRMLELEETWESICMRPPRTSRSGRRNNNAAAEGQLALTLYPWAPYGSTASAKPPRVRTAALHANISTALEPEGRAAIKWWGPFMHNHMIMSEVRAPSYEQNQGPRRRHHLRGREHEHQHQWPLLAHGHRGKSFQTREPQELGQGHLDEDELGDEIGTVRKSTRSMRRGRQRATCLRRQGKEAMRLKC